MKQFRDAKSGLARWPQLCRGDADAGGRRRDRERHGDNRRRLDAKYAGPLAGAKRCKPCAPRPATAAIPASTLQGTLRPYQTAGVRWLLPADGLGLGACLADDMGLGKTIQVLSLLLVARARRRQSRARRACWSRLPRCSPIGRARSKNLRQV